MKISLIQLYTYYIYIYMDKTDFNVYFFKYCVDLQGNYIHLINVGGLFLRLVSYIVVPNMSHFTFYMLHIYHRST